MKKDYKFLSNLFEDACHSNEQLDWDAYDIAATTLILHGSWGAAVHYYDLPWPSSVVEGFAVATVGQMMLKGE